MPDLFWTGRRPEMFEKASNLVTEYSNYGKSLPSSTATIKCHAFGMEKKVNEVKLSHQNRLQWGSECCAFFRPSNLAGVFIMFIWERFPRSSEISVTGLARLLYAVRGSRLIGIAWKTGRAWGREKIEGGPRFFLRLLPTKESLEQTSLLISYETYDHMEIFISRKPDQPGLPGVRGGPENSIFPPLD